MPPLGHLHEHSLPRLHCQDPPTIFPLRLLVFSLIRVSRLSEPGCLLVSSAGRTQCSFESMSSKPDVLKTPALKAPDVTKSCPSDALLVTAKGIGKQVPCGFRVCPALLGLFVLCRGSLPSEARTTQISPEPCLQPPPRVSATSFLFHCGDDFVGFRSISATLLLLCSASKLPSWLELYKHDVIRHCYQLTVLHVSANSETYGRINSSTTLMWQCGREHWATSQLSFSERHRTDDFTPSWQSRDLWESKGKSDNNTALRRHTKCGVCLKAG